MKRSTAIIALIFILTALVFSCARINRWQAVHTPPDEACMHCHYGIYKNWKISYRPYNEALKEGDYEPVHTSPMSAEDVEMKKSHKEGKGDCAKCHILPSAQEQLTISRLGMSLEDTSYQLCGRCHKSTFEEWKWSRFASKEISCLNCHSDPKDKPVLENEGYYHTKRGLHSIDSAITSPSIKINRLKEAVTLSESINVVGNSISVSLIVMNKGVGHSLPTSAINAALFARLIMVDSEGRVVDKKDVIIAGRGESSIVPGGDRYSSASLTAPRRGEYRIEISLNHIDRVNGQDSPIELHKKIAIASVGQ
ncbi:MAG: multiheme c-type cytochrome [bacterium]|nr:multiheme c-type cytochrome [bacterium]